MHRREQVHQCDFSTSLPGNEVCLASCR
jgi:hypothetical protein